MALNGHVVPCLQVFEIVLDDENVEGQAGRQKRAAQDVFQHGNLARPKSLITRESLIFLRFIRSRTVQFFRAIANSVVKESEQIIMLYPCSLWVSNPRFLLGAEGVHF